MVWCTMAKNVAKDLLVHLLNADETMMRWPECVEELDNLLKSLPERDLTFPLLACEAVGGKFETALPVSLAWIALHSGVVLLDKVIDRDGLDDFHSYEQIAALSSGPIFSAHNFLSRIGDPVIIFRTSQTLFQGFFHCAHGQYLDLMQSRSELPTSQAMKTYWQMTLLKSGSVYQAGLAGGAGVATDSPVLLQALGQYGQAFGVIKQIMDDCTDFLKENGEFEVTLPLLLYQNATQKSLPKVADRKALFKILDQARVPEKLSAVITEWQRRALESLTLLPPSEAKEKLTGYVHELVYPPEFFPLVNAN